MKFYQKMAVRDFVDSAKENGITDFMIADRELADELNARHCRSGKVDCGKTHEAYGIKVLAYGWDELGHVVALTADQYIKQLSATR